MSDVHTHTRQRDIGSPENAEAARGAAGDTPPLVWPRHIRLPPRHSRAGQTRHAFRRKALVGTQGEPAQKQLKKQSTEKARPSRT